MKLRELWGIPIPGTEKAVGLKKVSKELMGKVRTYYEPVGNKINEKKKKGDLYTDDNPKDTIKKLGYKDVSTARASVSRIRKSGRSHAHKIQAAVSMEQRAKAAGKSKEAAVFRRYINANKKGKK
tara:strand:- start:647 stop:1021 length:375 start_codon:yes stop_codon:yes gene_type:complete